MREKFRIWWPRHLSPSCQSYSTVLFGWYIYPSSASFDIVVAAALTPDEVSCFSSSLQGVLKCTNGTMPQFLQDKSTFCILGSFAADCSSIGKLQSVGMNGDDPLTSPNYRKLRLQNNEDIFEENCGQQSCGCPKYDGLLELCRETCTRNGDWIQLSNGYLSKETHWIPFLHHIHHYGQVVSCCDVHVIIYEPPTFGVHHFSLTSQYPLERLKPPLKKPNWVDELHQKQHPPDLDTVILAVNSAAAAKIFLLKYMEPKSSFHQFPNFHMLFSFVRKLVAMLVASFSTLLYIVLQFFHSMMIYGSQSLIYIMLARVFSHTSRNIHIRCCQLLYWPTFLQHTGPRLQSNVQYAERASLRKHSMWSSVAVDVLLGNVAGFALLFHAETACLWVFDFVSDITNNLLRSGCVWLMGVPAGFKLNTELAGVLGMTSLNAIQIWSTLWFFLGFLFKYFIKGLAISGIVSGLTIPIALTIDMIGLATLHISTLHWLISLLYSHQIQALAALWRLFRGRKWNPLRQRLDSYNYTVEQHIVGSLLFTPILLLLPTTSVFYIFFTIMVATVNFICILMEVTISILHATPYVNIFFWLVRRQRFPCGMWFEILSGQGNPSGSSELGCSKEVCSLSECSQPRKTKKDNRSRNVVSFIHSNFLTLGDIVLPHYRNVFRGVSASFVASSAYGVLLGKKIPSAVGTGLPSTMPWMSITPREYWCLCHDSVLGCMEAYETHGLN